MKHIFSIALAILFLVANSRAQDDLVKAKAKQIRDANNARQAALSGDSQAPAPAATTPIYTPATAAPSTPQGLNPAQQQLIERLESDFAIVKSGTPATDKQKESMLKEMTSLAKGSAKPTAAELTKLSTDMSLALAEKPFTAKDTQLFAKDVNIVENCAALTPTRAASFSTEIQNSLKRAGVSDSIVQAVGNDLNAIINEIQKAKPKLYQ